MVETNDDDDNDNDDDNNNNSNSQLNVNVRFSEGSKLPTKSMENQQIIYAHRTFDKYTKPLPMAFAAETHLVGEI